jgi:N-acetylglucosaminyldiphosphoundecaprenol N-acetyl-beta-D-mannosaminyltransferase
MRNTINIMGVPVDNVTMKEALEIVYRFLSENSIHAIYTPNSEIMMAAQREPYLKTILNDADLLVADGAGVVLASRILGKPLPEKVAGFDLVKSVLKISENKSISFFLFGSKPGVAEEAQKNILRLYPWVNIVGCQNGYFNKDEESKIIDNINSSNADILLVALGAPKQEKWIHENKSKLNVKVCIGVGGTLDVFAGKVKLAPKFFRKNGLEWLYRLYREPRRFIRMLDLPRFILLAMKTRLKKQ